MSPLLRAARRSCTQTGNQLRGAFPIRVSSVRLHRIFLVPGTPLPVSLPLPPPLSPPPLRHPPPSSLPALSQAWIPKLVSKCPAPWQWSRSVAARLSRRHRHILQCVVRPVCLTRGNLLLLRSKARAPWQTFGHSEGTFLSPTTPCVHPCGRPRPCGRFESDP